MATYNISGTTNIERIAQAPVRKFFQYNNVATFQFVYLACSNISSNFLS
ncbi:MAG TPA: hypothetical protein PLM63_03280 [bacterium]|nr:hypothetical protein [bacterium]